MGEATSIPIMTFLFARGIERGAPAALPVSACHGSARALIHAHVRAEIERARQQSSRSLSLQYLLSDNLRMNAEQPDDDIEAAVTRACRALVTGRYALIVDGVAIRNLDAPLAVTERSSICFVRLWSPIGG